MSKTDWFQNTTWNDEIAAQFEAKLRRAKPDNQPQYLRIQGNRLAAQHPQVALDLLDRYLALPVKSDRAQAYVDRASALLTLNRLEEALFSYEAALQREAEFKFLLTQAYIELPYLIAVRGLAARYPQALELLATHKSRLTFQIEHFKWNAAQALIAAAEGREVAAKMHALLAIKFSENKTPVFQRHPDVGIHTPEYEKLTPRLKALAGV